MPVCSVLTQGTCACVIGHIELAAEINAATYNSEGLQSPIKLTGPRGYHPIGKFLELAHGFYLPQIILVYNQKVITTKKYEMRLQQDHEKVNIIRLN